MVAPVDPENKADWARQHEWLAGHLNDLHRVLAAIGEVRGQRPTDSAGRLSPIIGSSVKIAVGEPMRARPYGGRSGPPTALCGRIHRVQS